MSDTPEHQAFPAVTTSDLSRTPRPVLDRVQRELLSDGVRGGRLVPARLSERFEFVDLIRSIENMAIRGLVRRTNRGWELTGRGMTIRETLMPGDAAD